MRSIAAMGFVLIATFATPTFAQSFVGHWVATAQTPGGPISETIDVTKTGDGYAIESKVIDPPAGMVEAGPGTDIVLDGDKFSYKRTANAPNGPVVLIYSGVVAGDAFTGTAEISGSGFQIPYNGVRAKTAK
jgi:hypothetical protein